MTRPGYRLRRRYRNPDRRAYVTRTEASSTWFSLARLREKNGDKEGARRARLSGRMVRGNIFRGEDDVL